MAGLNDVDFVLQFGLDLTGDDDGDFLELRYLAWLGPARRTHHASNTERAGARTRTADIFLDALWRMPGGID